MLETASQLRCPDRAISFLSDREIDLVDWLQPLKCRDWERALLEYCLALMDNTEDQVSGKKKLEDVKCPGAS